MLQTKLRSDACGSVRMAPPTSLLPHPSSRVDVWSTRGRQSSSRRSELIASAAATATRLQDFSPSRSPVRSPARSPSRISERCNKDIVLSFFDLLNARDIGGVLQLLSEDVMHQDLAHEQPATDRRGVARFYLELFSSMADNMKFVIEDITGAGSPSVGVTWHISVEGIELPVSKGLGFYKFNSKNKICFIRQSPEHFVKVAHLAMSATGMASPLVNVLGPAATPSFWANVIDTAATDGMQQIMGTVDSALAGLFTGDTSAQNPAQRAAPSRPTQFAQDGARPQVWNMPHLSSAAATSTYSFNGEQRASAQQGVAAFNTVDVSHTSMNTPTSAKVHVTADQLASALLAAANTSTLRSRSGTVNNVVSAPQWAGQVAEVGPTAAEAEVVTGPQHALASASGDEEPSCSRVAGVAPAVPVNLSGIWCKIPELSQQAEYEAALDLWEISGMQKATAKLIEGLEIHHQGSTFNVHHLTMIPYFKVTEKYNLEKPCQVMRRDLRSGQATATATRTEDQQGVVLNVSFGQPFPGKLEEVYYSPEPGVMHVTSTIFVKNQSVATNQVYHLLPPNMTKQDFIKQSEKKNGKANDILRKHGAPV